jgi:hypothetical protein
MCSNQSDGIGGFVSALFTVTPLSIFAQVTPTNAAHDLR